MNLTQKQIWQYMMHENQHLHTDSHIQTMPEDWSYTGVVVNKHVRLQLSFKPLFFPMINKVSII